MYNASTTIKRALDSINTNDTEILVVDDCSTDNSLEIVRNYKKESNKNIRIFWNKVNRGVGFTVNKIIDNVKGKYLILLGSDDYFYNDLERFANQLGEEDITYFNLEDNNSCIYRVTPETKRYYCGSVKAIRTDFIGATRCPEIRYGEDGVFYEELLKKNPTEKFTDILVKHYNFPRVGSLVWEAMNGNKEIR